jgi:hypothetical protein
VASSVMGPSVSFFWMQRFDVRVHCERRGSAGNGSFLSSEQVMGEHKNNTKTFLVLISMFYVGNLQQSLISVKCGKTGKCVGFYIMFCQRALFAFNLVLLGGI